jgi:hypothetical protein
MTTLPLQKQLQAMKPYWIVGKIMLQLGGSLLVLRLHSLLIGIQKPSHRPVYPASRTEFSR